MLIVIADSRMYTSDGGLAKQMSSYTEEIE